MTEVFLRADGAPAGGGQRDRKVMHQARWSCPFLLREYDARTSLQNLGRRFHDRNKHSIAHTAVVLRGYLRFVRPRIRRGDEEDAVVAVKRCGAHLVVWTSCLVIGDR